MIHHNDGKHCNYHKKIQKIAKKAQSARFASRQTTTVYVDRRFDQRSSERAIANHRWLLDRLFPGAISEMDPLTWPKLANDASEKFEFWSKPNSFDLGDLLDWEASWMLFSEEMRIVVSCCTFLGGISRHFTYPEMGWVKLPINQYSRCSETFLLAWSTTSQITRARPRQPGIVNKRPWGIRAHVNCRSSLTMLQSEASPKLG